MSNPPTFSGFAGFGNTANAANAAQQQSSGSAPAPASNIFGAASGGTGGGLFGSSVAASNPSGQAPKAFGSGFGFGSTTPATTPGAPAPSGGLFGNSNTTGGAASSNAPAPSLFSKPGTFGNAAATTTSATGASTGGGLFGNTTSTVPAGGSNIFGSGLLGAKPATSGTTSTAPATGGLFGTQGKPAETPVGASNAPAPATSIFGNLGNPATGGSSLFGPPAPTAGATSTAPPALPSLFGKKDSSQTTTAAGTTTAPATGGLGLFGAANAKDAGSTAPTTNLFGAKPTTSMAPAPTSTPGFNLFGNPAGAKDPKDSGQTATGAAPTGATDPVKTSTLATGLLGPGTTTQPSTSNPTAATTAPPLLPPSVLKGKSLEDIVDQWSADLEVQAVEFKRLAGEVQEWDRVLIDNGNQIALLHTAVMDAERVQNDVEKSLEHIEDQQKQLADALDGYEQATDGILESQGMRGMDVGPADAERGKNYALATSLNAQLDGLARSLSAMIDEVNSVTASSQYHIKSADNTTTLAASAQKPDTSGAEEMDPMTQIQNILNAHLDSLSWINGTVRDLEGKVGDLERKFGSALPPAEERRERAPQLGRNGSSRGMSVQQQSTVLDGSSVLGSSSRFGYGLRR